eukprot:g15237.t1
MFRDNELAGEIEQLEEGLKGAMKLLRIGGRCAILTFTVRERRAVHEFLRQWEDPPLEEQEELSPQRLAELYPLSTTPCPYSVQRLDAPRGPGGAEVAQQPRARSSVLVVLQKSRRTCPLPEGEITPRPVAERFKEPRGTPRLHAMALQRVPASMSASCSIFVGNVPYDASEDELKELFGRVGNVTSVRLVLDKDTKTPKGYAFADFADPASVQAAVEKLNHVEYNGRKLRIDAAERELQNPFREDGPGVSKGKGKGAELRSKPRAMGDKAALAALGIAEAPPKAAPPEPSGPHFTSAAEDPKRDLMKSVAELLKRKRLRASDLFKKIDSSGDGNVTGEELRMGLHDLGFKLSDADLASIMAVIDKDGGGEVSVKEFDRAMRAAEKLPSKKEKHDAGLGLDEELSKGIPAKKAGITEEEKEEFRQIFCLFKQLTQAHSESGPGLTIDPASLPKVDTIIDKLQRQKEQEERESVEGEQVARLMETLTPAQVLHLLGEMQRLTLRAPDVARALLGENIQLALALQHAQFLAGMLEDSLTSSAQIRAVPIVPIAVWSGQRGGEDQGKMTQSRRLIAFPMSQLADLSEAAMAVMHMARHAMPHGVDVRPASPMYLTPRSHSPHAHLRNLMVPPGQMMTQTQPAALQLGQVGSMPAPAIAAAVANLISQGGSEFSHDGM